jgi:hypothetical protein
MTSKGRAAATESLTVAADGSDLQQVPREVDLAVGVAGGGGDRSRQPGGGVQRLRLGVGEDELAPARALDGDASPVRLCFYVESAHLHAFWIA